MRWALVAIVGVAFAACGGPPNRPDLEIDAGRYMCPSGPPQVPVCADTCGNGRIDRCAKADLNGEGCPVWREVPEACDGAGPSCASLGFYAGTAACTTCVIDDGSCDPCDPGDLSCAALDPVGIVQIAVSGPRIAIGAIALFDGVTPIARLDIAYLHAIVGTPDGWLVNASLPPTLATLDATGALGQPHPIAPAALGPAMAFGAGQRAVLAWKQLVDGHYRVFAELADLSATVVIPPFELFDSDGTQLSAATDGTSFFVTGGGGMLARIAPDGAHTVAGGFPVVFDSSPRPNDVRVTWSGNTGWFVARTNAAYEHTAQRFDSSGAPQGTPLPIDLGFQVADVLADGDDLLVLTATGHVVPTLQVVRIAPTGSIGAPHTVGVGSPSGALARLGDQIIVGWTRPKHAYLATIAP